jgi:hypothetical protein
MEPCLPCNLSKSATMRRPSDLEALDRLMYEVEIWKVLFRKKCGENPMHDVAL